jgi:hypothetical protein
MILDIVAMNSNQPAQLLEQIAQIKRMERGKLTLMSESPEGPHFKLQAWENGKNVSRHVSRDQAELVQEALQGYRTYQDLTQQYAQNVIDQTRAELATQSKKKIYHLRRKSSWPKTKKSAK